MLFCTDITSAVPPAQPVPLARGSHRKRGAALIVVLGAVLLLTVIVLAFFSSVRTNYLATRYEADGSGARNLIHPVIGLVQSLLREATTNAGFAWTSQPGLLRTFGADGQALEVLRLYSWDKPREAAANFTSAGEVAALVNWSNSPGRFVDLNAPEVVAGATNYPILDPTAEGRVEGFSITANPGIGSQPGAAPMPVRWLYVLSQGEIVAPSGGSGPTATFSGNTLPSAQNPIVGRVAFWTDDESCKLNINTASEGSAWLVPVTQGTSDGYATQYTPANAEFNRYPGHPASTCLSPVFAGSNFNGKTVTPLVPGSTARWLIDNSPHIRWGGSENATKPTTSAQPLTNKLQRLYASVDEYLFTNPTSEPREAGTLLTASIVEKSRFFLTASSRAPETTLFGTPRISLWPVSSRTGSSYRTVYDELLTFCATVNSNAFCFQRSDPNNAGNVDFNLPRNQGLFSYLQALTSRNIPGFGGNFSSKLGTDRDPLLLNMVDLIRQANLMDWNLPSANRFTPGTSTGTGWTSPLRPADANAKYRAFGRALTVTAAGMVFIATADADSSASTITPAPYPGNAPGPFTVRIPVTVFPVLDVFSPSYGMAFMWPNLKFVFKEITGFNLTWNNGGASQTATLTFNNLNKTARVTRLNGFPIGVQSCNAQGGPLGITTPMFSDAGSSSAGNWPQAQATLTFTVPDRNSLPTADYQLMDVSGGNLTAEIRNNITDELLQTVRIEFPPARTVTPVAPRIQQYNKKSSYPMGLWPFSRLQRPPSFGNRFTFAHDGHAGSGYGQLNTWRTLIQPGDTVLSVVGKHPKYGSDYRMFAMATELDPTFFTPHPDYPYAPGSPNGAGRVTTVSTVVHSYFPSGPTWPDTTITLNSPITLPVRQAHSFRMGEQPYMKGDPFGLYLEPENPRAALVAGLAGGSATMNASGYYTESIDGPSYQRYGHRAPILPPGTDGVSLQNNSGGSSPGDWENGITGLVDGAYIRKPDDGHRWQANSGDNGSEWKSTPMAPYYMYNPNVTTETLFTPNRIVASGIQFGALPTGFQRQKPWQTLLFNPHPAAGWNSHPGSQSPPDHLLLDLFWMPVIQPYAISEPFSTAGKVNMNHRMEPFNYLVRDTALRGVLKSVQLQAIPLTAAKDYKKNHGHGIWSGNYRFDVNLDETLRQFEDRFNSNQVFKAESEICALSLVPGNELTYSATAITARTPTGATRATVSDWWTRYPLTGDNTREAPYNHVYPRLTTRSNTYTIHLRVQSLKQTPVGRTTAAQWATWDDNRDAITAEYRGATLVERYIDPNDKRLPDFALDPTKSTNPYYRFRIVSERQFAP